MECGRSCTKTVDEKKMEKGESLHMSPKTAVTHCPDSGGLEPIDICNVTISETKIRVPEESYFPSSDWKWGNLPHATLLDSCVASKFGIFVYVYHNPMHWKSELHICLRNTTLCEDLKKVSLLLFCSRETVPGRIWGTVEDSGPLRT